MAKKCQCSRIKRIRTNPDGTSSSSEPTCKFCLEKLKEVPEKEVKQPSSKPKEVVDPEIYKKLVKGALKILNNCKKLADLQKVYTGFSKGIQAEKEVIELKDKLKNDLK